MLLYAILSGHLIFRTRTFSIFLKIVSMQISGLSSFSGLIPADIVLVELYFSVFIISCSLFIYQNYGIPMIQCHSTYLFGLRIAISLILSYTHLTSVVKFLIQCQLISSGH